MTDYSFGIEIEVVVAPHKLRTPLSYALYYEKLAAALRNRGLKAKADDLQGSYSKRPEHYDKWWVTKDGSLGTYQDKVAMEAVSPVLRCQGEWQGEISTFWKGMKAVFHMPDRSSKCGSHVHVSKGRNKTFTLAQLKTIAFGVLFYEDFVLDLLMANRTNNRFCKPNSENSAPLRACGHNRAQVAQLIRGAADTTALRDVMQNDRYVLWNFANIVHGKSGTVEFRGGRCLRGEVRTKWWIAFTVAFIHAILTMNNIRNPNTSTLSHWSTDGLYKEIKKAARQLSFGDCLPSDYRQLNETHY